jgi:predicted transposase YdaD
VPKPFDAATKFLTETQPSDWVSLFALPAGATQVLDADLSTVTAAADRVFRIEARVPYLLHIEFQGNVDAELALRSLLYNAGLRARYKLPVKTAIVLLRPFHGHKLLTGEALWDDPDGVAITFHYRVVRLWQVPVQSLLHAGLSLLPLAPVAQVRKSQLPGILATLRARLDLEASPELAASLWTATYVLMGLRYPRWEVEELMSRDVLELLNTQLLEQSSTYRGMVEEVELRHARTTLLRLGRKRLGEPTAAHLEALEALQDRERMENLMERLLEVETWNELLAA